MLLAALLACGGPTKMTASREVPPRAPDCDFEVLTAPPGPGYYEIAVVDVPAAKQYDKVGRFKDHIRPHVCEAGGDAAWVLANGAGVYIKATVLKRATPVQAQPVAATPAPTEGCKFDAQCKGDRICVAGECRAPAPSAPPATGTPSPAATGTTAPTPTAGGTVAPTSPPAPTTPPTH